MTGFAKAYQRERPDALVKAVDFPVSRKTAALADVLVDETLRDPGCVEVGHADGPALGRRPGRAPVPERRRGRASSSAPDRVFVVTGAAGSIVSAITADLAAASARHVPPARPDPGAGPGRPGPAPVRRGPGRASRPRLAARLRGAGRAADAGADRTELARFERLQAALAAVHAVEDAGGTAHYHCVDLTDADAVEKVLAEVRDISGRVDVLLHAAGMEVSHALPDKEPREFDLVLGVKGDGCSTCCMPPDDLPIGTVVAFSSVAGRFGNAGQTDYSAANDLLCKMISSFRRTRPGLRALAIDWTAWGGIGMATRGSIPKIMEMAGVEMLPARGGRGVDPARADTRGIPAARSSSPVRWARWPASTTTPAGSTRRRCRPGRTDARRGRRAERPRRPGGAHHAGPGRSAVPRRPPHRRHPGAARRDGHGGVRRGGPAARARLARRRPSRTSTSVRR